MNEQNYADKLFNETADRLFDEIFEKMDNPYKLSRGQLRRIARMIAENQARDELKI